MKKYLILIFIFSFLNLPANTKEKNKLIFNASSQGNENLSIYKTPLTEKEQIEDLKKDLKIKNEFLRINADEIAKTNKNRPKRNKFKGTSEDIFTDYANSVVFIGNIKNSGSGFVINHNGKKIITNWHVVEGAKRVDVWLKPKDIRDERYLIKNVDSYKAKVIKVDKQKDLALLEVIDLPKNIKPVQLGNYFFSIVINYKSRT